MSLDPAQEAAVRTDAGRVLVLAGAGSGKTRTLTARVAHLVRDRAVAPERILLATFTRRAAREMTSRLAADLGAAARLVRAGTFHALAIRVLRSHGPALGLPSDFTLLSRAGRRTLAAEALIEAGLEPRGQPGVDADRFLRTLSRAENEERPLSEVIMDLEPDLAAIADALEAAAEHFTEAKARSHVLDFDDLLVLWRALLDPDSEIARQLTAELDHVLVDEFQDTTPLQARLTEDLATGGAGLFVVGDDAQSIYGFRGARFDNILEFPTRRPTEVHQLLTSYRSGPPVVAVARATLAADPLQFPKALEASAVSGPPVHVVRAVDETEEASWVARKARALDEAGVPYSAQGLLVRRHRDSAAFELAFTSAGIPHHVRTGGRFLDRPHVRAVVAHLTITTQPKDWVAWREVLALRPGFGPVTTAATVEALQRCPMEGPQALRHPEIRAAVGARSKPGLQTLSTLMDRLAPHAGAGDFFDALLHDDDLAVPSCLALAEDETTARQDLEQLVLMEREDPHLLETLALGEAPEPTGRQGLTLSTIHAAKGLEWRAVFVVGMEDGSFPSRLALRDAGGESEERRLFYVAVTRAAEHLFLTWAEQSPRGFGSPSRFIEALPAELYRAIDAG